MSQGKYEVWFMANSFEVRDCIVARYDDEFVAKAAAEILNRNATEGHFSVEYDEEPTVVIRKRAVR
jgi:hypothetical protein